MSRGMEPKRTIWLRDPCHFLQDATGARKIPVNVPDRCRAAWLGPACVAFILVLAEAVPAQAGAEFYKGRTVELDISTSVGGGYDAYARLAGAAHRPVHSREPDHRRQEHGGCRRIAARELSLQRRAEGRHRPSAPSTAAPVSIRCSATRARSSTRPVQLDRQRPTTRSASASPGTPAASHASSRS